MDIPLTIKDAAALLRSGETTSVELTRAYLDRIERLNPTLGAYICYQPENALSEAAVADALFAAGVDREIGRAHV